MRLWNLKRHDDNKNILVLTCDGVRINCDKVKIGPENFYLTVFLNGPVERVTGVWPLKDNMIRDPEGILKR